MFASLLIANRGEIACRVIRAAKALGLRAIAVYSEADTDARHVRMADEAHLIGPPPAADSYLCAEAILEAARASGAEAIHPGYGFLAENADFAASCAEAGLIFVGPSPAVMRTMGLKSEAKRLMAEAGVATLPGYHGGDQDNDSLALAARDIGYPLLIKPIAGGGGKGMRLVARAEDLAGALDSARREAVSAFGDDRLLLERYLDKPRHIEFQVLADSHGQAVHLFERDCSIQRRHQKVIEEAPAPGMTADLRARMGEAAVAATRAAGYVGAGTIEFIVDVTDGLAPAPFYFMEMNTRLQVEHPVTEMITGIDLVAWQLRIAAGEPLGFSQSDLEIHGHAIEARIYAEDPARDFLPATGTLVKLRPPAEGPDLRLETGVDEGDRISVHYDPMIAKLIVRGASRAAALDRLSAALAAYRVAGVANNIGLLAAVAGHRAFAAGDIDTGFIAAHGAELIGPPGPVPDDVLALACLDELLTRAEAAREASASDIWSPWRSTTAWRLHDRGHDRLYFDDGGHARAVRVDYEGDQFDLALPGGTLRAWARRDDDGDIHAVLGSRRITATVVRHDGEVTIILGPVSHRLGCADPRLESHDAEEASDIVTAPMPGKVIKILARAGQKVEKGEGLVILEAMKMEHTIAAPAPGQIAAIEVARGSQVEDGDILVTFEAESEAGP